MLNVYKHALVTGASGGIGGALCAALSEQGVQKITLAGRREDALNAVASLLDCETEIITADLSKTADVERLASQLGDVDLLVNNAGFGSFGPFGQSPNGNDVNMVQVNCGAPVALTAALLPRMLNNGHGCVVNIASGMAFQPMPYMSTYAATKAFLLHWGEGIAQELRGTGVHMITVCPGTVHTGFADAGGIPLERMFGVAFVTVGLDTVVRQTIAAIKNKRTVVVPGVGNRLGSIIGRMVPRRLLRGTLGLAMGHSYSRCLTD